MTPGGAPPPPFASGLTAGIGGSPLPLAAREIDPLPKVPSGVAGLDQLTLGGLPEGRATLVMGTAGSGKTMLSAQFLAQAAVAGEGAVFVTFEEPAEDLRSNLGRLGWDVASWEREGRWRFVDGSPFGPIQADEDGEYPISTLLAQIGKAVDETAASRIVLDSANVALADDPRRGRQQLRRLLAHLRALGMTVVVTVEAPGDDTAPSDGFEKFVVDAILVLRNSLEAEKRRRTLEVVKLRGATHLKGEFPFTIFPGQGVVVIPLSVIDLGQASTDVRVSSGNPTLDEICAGGFFRDSVVLVSGATGTGKTLMATEFLAGAGPDERVLLFAFEESRDQIFRNARAWGRDFAGLERAGLLRVVATYPETASLEDHLVRIVREIAEFRPARVAIDSLSALERSGTPRGFQEFVIVLSAYIKGEQVAGLFTSSVPSLLGGPSVTESHISTLTDSIILLRYVELDSRVRRALTVLKMRGSHHDPRIWAFDIDSTGMRIGEPFPGITGILSGQISALDPPEPDRNGEDG